ncbi:MAG: hypothetical protein WD176_08415, partial [Pirellulales bacterium]
RHTNEKIKKRHERLIQWQSTGEPAFGWEPTPDEDGLEQLVLRLNAWIETQDFSASWSPDPLLDSLSKVERASIDYSQLTSTRFTAEDGRLLQEAVWLRDIARHAVTATVPLEQAFELFDWTVRNIQLEADDAMGGVRQRPWQTLISGRGTAAERAWVFVLLARQRGFHAVVLSIGKDAAHSPRALVAVDIGDQAYLFDTELGLPIPKAKGNGIATLAEAKTDPKVFGQLSLDAAAYAQKSEDISAAVALVEASPLYLSQRAERLERQLAGRDRVVLTVAPSRVAAAFRKHVSEVRIWDISAQTRRAQQVYSPETRALLADQFHAYAIVPHLWKARVLFFRGDDHVLQLDYADRLVRTYSRYHDPRVYLLYDQVRPSEKLLETLRGSPTVAGSLRFSKRNANYWLGLLAYADGDYRVAIDYLAQRTLTSADNPWTSGARYNLARTHEQLARLWRQRRKAPPIAWPTSTLPAAAVSGRFSLDKLPSAEEMQRREASELAAAVKLYNEDNGPGRLGSQLRAKWLTATQSADP